MSNYSVFPSDEQIKRMLSLCRLATPGKWSVDSGNCIESEFGATVIESTEESFSDEEYGILQGANDANYIAAANPGAVGKYLRCLVEAKAVLQKIVEDVGDKADHACPVCGTYTHKGWCWYPYALRLLGKELDENDLNFLDAASHD